MAGQRAGIHLDARPCETCLGWCVSTLELARCQAKSTKGCRHCGGGAKWNTLVVETATVLMGGS
jgi:hypothetical protein